MRAVYVLVLFPLLCSFSAEAQNQQNVPIINVSGNAEVLVVPDKLKLVMSVESRHETLEEAKKQNDASIQEASQFLLEQGIPKDAFRTDVISIDAQYDSGRDRGRIVPEAYVVRRQFALETDQIDKFEQILQGLIERGVNRVADLQMLTSRLREVRDEARMQAIRAAREKAEALAHELGAKLKGVSTISENTYGGYWRPNNQNYMMQNSVQMAGGGETPSLAVGRIKVSAVVNVVFTLKDVDFDD